MCMPHGKGMILMALCYMTPQRDDAIRARVDEYGAIVR